MTYEDRRSHEQHDRDRVLYSSAFRRLGGVTQVVAVHEKQLLHNRLTHTLKVAQLARRLAEALLADPDNAPTVRHSDDSTRSAPVLLHPEVAETAALAHDLGHPPFGHIAEQELHRLCQKEDLDGFNGNAQSFRIVTKLASRNALDPGLGLQRSSLNGILKYPWLREGAHEADRKFGAYLSDREIFETVREGIPTDARTIEAEIMDWCDDVTYATHDLEDFYRAGLVPLERVTTDPIERDRFLMRASAALASGENDYDPDLAARAFEDIRLLVSPDLALRATRRSRRALHRQTNTLITRYMGAVRLHRQPPFIEVSKGIRHEVMILKQLTWQYVVNSPSLAMAQQGQRSIIRVVFRGLTEWVTFEMKEGSQHRLPPRLAGYLEDLRNDPQAINEIRRRVEARAASRLRDAEAALTAAANQSGLASMRLREQLHTAKAAAEAASTDGCDRAVNARAVSDYISFLTEDQLYDLHEKLTGSSRGSIFEGWVNA